MTSSVPPPRSRRSPSSAAWMRPASTGVSGPYTVSSSSPYTRAELAISRSGSTRWRAPAGCTTTVAFGNVRTRSPTPPAWSRWMWVSTSHARSARSSPAAATPRATAAATLAGPVSISAGRSPRTRNPAVMPGVPPIRVSIPVTWSGSASRTLTCRSPVPPPPAPGGGSSLEGIGFQGAEHDPVARLGMEERRLLRKDLAVAGPLEDRGDRDRPQDNQGAELAPVDPGRTLLQVRLVDDTVLEVDHTQAPGEQGAVQDLDVQRPVPAGLGGQPRGIAGDQGPGAALPVDAERRPLPGPAVDRLLGLGRPRGRPRVEQVGGGGHDRLGRDAHAQAVDRQHRGAVVVRVGEEHQQLVPGALRVP